MDFFIHCESSVISSPSVCFSQSIFAKRFLK